jgi:hypothetical protein
MLVLNTLISPERGEWMEQILPSRTPLAVIYGTLGDDKGTTKVLDPLYL